MTEELMARSKTIKLFLMDGEATGRIKCSLANWTGIAYKIPRTALDRCKDIEYLQQSGVYFLFGTDENYDQIVYVGQAGVRKNGKGLLLRIQEPHQSIDWTEAVMFTTTNNSFGPTERSYLENRFCNLAMEAGRYQVKNGNDPNPGNITEETESELEEFIDYAKIVMGALGHKVFEPLLSQASETGAGEPLLHMEYRKCRATGKRTNDGFVILKGSVVNPVIAKSCPENVIKARKKYADKINDEHELIADILMTSQSAAAGFIGGASLSGNAMWHDEHGTPLKQMIG